MTSPIDLDTLPAHLLYACEEGERDKTVQKILEEKLGKGARIEAFVRFQIGK